MIGDERVQGTEGTPFFRVALNLPHAGRIARRIVLLLHSREEEGGPRSATSRRTAAELLVLLDPCLELDENPPGKPGYEIRDRAAALGRRLVDEIEGSRIGHDRLGQCVRNLFECLELGQEGAEISLRAGENPKSMQRPT